MTKVPFVWDEPQNNNPTVSVYINGVNRHRHVKLNKMKELKAWHVPEQNCYLHFKIRVKGRAKILVITSSTQATETKKKEDKVDEKDKIDVHVKLAGGFGLSLVDTSPQEVMYLNVKGIELKFFQSNLQQSIEFSIDSVQVRFNKTWPIIWGFWPNILLRLTMICT